MNTTNVENFRIQAKLNEGIKKSFNKVNFLNNDFKNELNQVISKNEKVSSYENYKNINNKYKNEDVYSKCEKSNKKIQELDEKNSKLKEKDDKKSDLSKVLELLTKILLGIASKEDLEELKKTLKENGFSEEEILSMTKGLEEAIELNKKLDKSQKALNIKDSSELFNIKDIENILDKVNSKETLKNENGEKVLKEFDNILNLLKGEKNNVNFKNVSNENKNVELLNKIKETILKQDNNKENLSSKEEILTSIKLNNSQKLSSENESFKGMNDSYKGNISNKEEEFLQKLVNKENNKDSFNNTLLGINNKNLSLSQINLNENLEDVNSNLVLNKNNMVNDVIKVVKYMENNSMKNLTVKVMPKELGEIVIKLTFQAGRMKLALNATEKDTFNLLNANLEDIADELSTNNIKIQTSDVALYHDDTTFFNGQFNNESNMNERKRNENTNYNIRLSKDESIEEENEVRIEDESNLNILA